jgi:lantibiotic modifying enzyme
MAIFMSYASRELGSPRYAAFARALVENVISYLESGKWRGAIDIGLFTGLPGIVWAVDHTLHVLGDFGDNDSIATTEFDNALAERIRRHDRCDLITGLAGIGIYAIHRERVNGDTGLIETIKEQLDMMNKADSRPARHGLGSDLGMAHGIAGLIGFLSESLRIRNANDLDSVHVQQLLLTTTTQLERSANSQAHRWRFDRAIGDTKVSPMAWCYGDPGILCALIRAALATNNLNMHSMVASLSQTILNRPYISYGITEPGLCHGFSGALHIFNCARHLTGNARFEELAVRMLEITLGMCDTVGHQEFWQRFQIGATSRPIGLGLLYGASGIGLSLLSAISHSDQRWDTPLLIGTH